MFERTYSSGLPRVFQALEEVVPNPGDHDVASRNNFCSVPSLQQHILLHVLVRHFLPSFFHLIS